MKRSKNKYLRPLPLILTAVAVLIAVVTVLKLTSITYFFHKRAVSSTIPADKSIGSNTADRSRSDPQSKPDKDTTSQPSTSDKSTVPPTSSAELLTPYGNFVSNHHPSMGAAPNSSSEESICTTTPGAFCTIIFKKDGVTKTLESLQTDNSGTAIWQWDVKSADFIPGTWTVNATATLNGQTKSIDDLQPLEVQP